ncbi:MAG: hypothetical protein R3F01_02870 [Lysobacteraceae bacterium]
MSFNIKKAYRCALAAAIAGVFSIGVASAAEVAVTDAATAPVGGGAVTPTPIPVQFTGDGTTVGYQCNITYNPADVDITTANNGTGLCSDNDAGTLTILDGTLDNSPLGNVTSCNLTITVIDGTAADAETYPLDVTGCLFSDNVGGPSPGPHTETDGLITVQAAPPTTQTITASGNAGGTVAPPSQDVTSGTSGVVTITPNGGFQVSSIGGTCGGTPDVAPPTSATVTYTTNPVGTAGDPDNSADCTVTATFAAIPAPIYSSAPPAGSDIACNGPPGSTATSTINVTNTGNLDLNIASCTFGGADFSVDSFPATLAPSASGPIEVSCTVPAEGDPAVTDTLSCTHDAAGSPAEYRYSSVGITVPPAVPTPDLVPASSLWSKLMLFGFLAGLGALVISLRRS